MFFYTYLTSHLELVKQNVTDRLRRNGVSYDEMYKHVSKKTSIERVHPEGRRLSYDVAEEISKLDIQIPGTINPSTKRLETQNFVY